MFLDAIFGRRSTGLPSVPRFLKAFEVKRSDIVERPRIPVAGRLLSWQTRVPHYLKGNFRSLVYEGFRKNPVVRRCQAILAENFSQAELEFVDAETNVNLFTDLGNPLGDVAGFLLGMIQRGGRYKATPGWTRERLWTHLIQDYFNYGNTIWEKVRSVRTGRVVELWRLHPQQVAVEVSPHRGVKRYLYNADGKWWPIAPRDIVHGLAPDPEQDFFGLPPLVSAHRDIQTDNELTDHLKITLQNLAIPPIVLESTQKLNPTKAEEIREAWKMTNGRQRRGEPGVIGEDIKVQVVGLNMEQMAIGELTATSETRLSMIHGVPIILLGRSSTGGDPTRANYSEAKLQLWEETLVPCLGMVETLVNVSLVPEFDPTGTMCARFNTRGVRVLQEARLRRGKVASEIFETGLVSRHHGQRLAGLPVHGPDVFYRPDTVGGIVPVSDTQEAFMLQEENV